ncbi:ATP-dependent DNA helicase [Acidithiobacillus caldus]|uniref:ATP-dependent DNA helicase n=1 Tax=Acidithiobacillus caldus TaxID=33059 RepID=UPI001C070020|nr:helicase C-terminal domain-containing protein [Acidithiobacillus caldus]MBU2762342.1 ATP-dependent DNA helicase DinG [Acidithiobacillus caldus]MBU2771839.1 ATP-dependent DNA helicase DinG [Acidithiobacillus caldus]
MSKLFTLDRFAGAGLRLRSLQIRVAQDVDRCLVEPLPEPEAITSRDGEALSCRRSLCGFIEAGTGVGKTIGYLVPLLEYASQHKKRVGISTYTRFQQRQVAKDLALVQQRIFDGLDLQVAIRLGRQNFVSRERVAFWRERLKGTDLPKAWEDFFAWVDRWDESTDPLDTTFLAWREIYPDMPEFSGLAEEDFALREDEPHAWYEAHAKAAQSADVVITNHATLLIHGALKTGLLGDLDAVVVDEADQLISAAQSLLSRRLRASLVVRDLRRQYPDPKEFDFAEARQEADAIQDLLRELGETLEYRETLLSEWLARFPEESAALRGHLDRLIPLLPSPSARRNFQRVLAGLDGGETVDVVYSPIRHLPAFHIDDLEPERFVGKLFVAFGEDEVFLPRVVLVSATLSDPMTEKLDFVHQTFGLFRQPFLTSRYEPDRFGSMTFVLPDPRVGAPFLVDDEDLSERMWNPEWLAYVENALGIDDHHKLLLTPSFEDIARWMERRGLEVGKTRLHDGILYHQSDVPGAKLVQRIEQDPDVRVVITPSLWEGVNLRLDGKPWMQDVLIARVPIPPYSPLLQERKIVWRLARQVEQARKKRERGEKAVWRTEEEVRAELVWESAKKALRRLRQGLGRGIRDERDAVRVWMLDPRVRFPTDALNGLLFVAAGLEDGEDLVQAAEKIPAHPALRRWSQSVPARFRGQLSNADIFLRDGTLSSLVESEGALLCTTC